jgi:hypothetical protein
MFASVEATASRVICFRGAVTSFQNLLGFEGTLKLIVMFTKPAVGTCMLVYMLGCS